MVEKVLAKLELDAKDLGGSLGRISGKGGVGGSVGEMAKKDSKNFQTMTGALVTGLAVWEGIKKGVQQLVKFSPALQNTIQIFGSSMRLLLKPVGDLISVILRPFALAMLKWAIPFYRSSMKALQTTGGKVGGAVGGIAGIIGGVAAGAGIAKLIGGLAALGSIAGPVGTAVGAIVGVLIAALGALLGLNFGAEIEEWLKSIKKFFAEVDWAEFFGKLTYFLAFGLPLMVWEGVQKIGEAFSKLFTEVIPFALGYLYESIIIFWTETFPEILDKIKNAVVKTFTAIGNFIKSIPSLVVKGWIAFRDFMISLPQLILKAFEAIGKFFTETIPGWFRSIGNAIKGVIDRIVGAFGRGREARRSVGDAILRPSGEIIETDPRDTLIATRNPNALLAGGQGMVYSPTIYVNAAINTDMDIQRLAEKLADYSKDELSRRTADFRI